MLTYLKKILHREKGPAYDKIMELDDSAIIVFKSKAWQGADSVRAYTEAVERPFFDNITANMILCHLKPGFKVLDVGAGTGRLTMPVADMGCSVTAVDISAEMLDVIEAEKGSRAVETVKASGEDLPFADNTFDAIVQMDFLIHFPSWRQILVEELRICKPGGIIIFNFINADNLRSFKGGREAGISYISGGGYFASCTREELEIFVSAQGSKIVSIQPYNIFFNSYGENVLSRQEFSEFSRLLRKTFADQRVMSAVTKLEQEIIAKLPEDIAPFAVMAIQKL